VTARSRSAERIWSVPIAPPPRATTAGVIEARASTACFDSREPERRLATGLEDPRDRLLALDLAVDVDERAAPAAPRARLPASTSRAHEADQRNVTV
jgi:hypothetical protein